MYELRPFVGAARSDLRALGRFEITEPTAARRRIRPPSSTSEAPTTGSIGRRRLPRPAVAGGLHPAGPCFRRASTTTPSRSAGSGWCNEPADHVDVRTDRDRDGLRLHVGIVPTDRLRRRTRPLGDDLHAPQADRAPPGHGPSPPAVGADGSRPRSIPSSVRGNGGAPRGRRTRTLPCSYSIGPGSPGRTAQRGFPVALASVARRVVPVCSCSSPRATKDAACTSWCSPVDGAPRARVSPTAAADPRSKSEMTPGRPRHRAA